MTRTADVVIIGGGVTGVSVAFHLAGAGVRRVVVLERRVLASGGTGRSVGIVRQLYPTAETSAMVRRSLTVFQHFADAVGGDAGYVACGARSGPARASSPTFWKPGSPSPPTTSFQLRKVLWAAQAERVKKSIA